MIKDNHRNFKSFCSLIYILNIYSDTYNLLIQFKLEFIKMISIHQLNRILIGISTDVLSEKQDIILYD